MIIEPHPGWFGFFTREQAEGAIANGSRVQKIKSEHGDSHLIGECATVLGSIYVPSHGLAYFLEWDATPKTAVLVVGWKIEARNDRD